MPNKMKAHDLLLKRVMDKLYRMGCIPYRNESKAAWVGNVVHQEGSMVTLDKAARVQVGLVKGSADIVGFDAPPHQPFARFFGIEIKTGSGMLTKEQREWINCVRQNGGIAGVARSVEDAVEIIEASRNE